MGFNIMRREPISKAGTQKVSPPTQKRKKTVTGKNAMDISNRSGDSTQSSSSFSTSKPSKKKTLKPSASGATARKVKKPERRKTGTSDSLSSSQHGLKKKLGGGSLEDLMGVPTANRVLKKPGAEGGGGGRMPRRQSFGGGKANRNSADDSMSLGCRSEHGLSRPKIRYQKSDSAIKPVKKKAKDSATGSTRTTVGPDRKIKRSKSGGASVSGNGDLDMMESKSAATSKPSTFGESEYNSRFSFDASERSVRETRMDERLQKEEEKNDELSRKVGELERQIQDLKFDNDQVNRKLRKQRDAEREIAEKNKEINELSDTVDRILEAERKVEGYGFGGSGASKSSATEERLREELRLANAKVQTLEKCLSDKQEETQKIQMELSCYRDSSKSSAVKTVEASLQKENADLQEKIKFKDETIEHLMDQLKNMKSGGGAGSGGAKSA
eukprot:CAMPEP_0117078914 /NCGR_PEP_ID=MMETSP0472-20121206/55651_1 /TAXON_ID=693140 ORGANISM="Tiarina fusus, Strain LIS" /NCGR_SAMPLE_ID=MMETSP0472 /ASSEMBLY_ACC=CAM_ASM_000603 /LENGTH=441 /DNA_ID=CAMNT_0004805873 /DNA_START=143 /DNA_END=1463 /DNA_ORIENTATION=+